MNTIHANSLDMICCEGHTSGCLRHMNCIRASQTKGPVLEHRASRSKPGLAPEPTSQLPLWQIPEFGATPAHSTGPRRPTAMSDLKIECPKCNHPFELTEALAGPMLEAER